MKRDNWMHAMLLSHRRRNSSPNRLCVGRIVMSLILVIMLLAAESCKQKDENTTPVERGAASSEDIRIRYRDIESQKQELQKFEEMIHAKSAIEEPYVLLRQMVEHVSLGYIQTHLQELSQNASAKEEPNISILLDRINEMRNLDDAGLSSFIEKAKAEGDADKLTVAVFGLRNEVRQAKAAEALASFGKPESVRLLTMRLFHAAGLHSGGLEAKFFREQLRQSLVKALASCTGLDFSDYDPTSNTATLAIVKRCQDWLEKNELKGN